MNQIYFQNQNKKEKGGRFLLFIVFFIFLSYMGKNLLNSFYWGKLIYNIIFVTILLFLISYYMSKYYTNNVNNFSQWFNKSNYDKYGNKIPNSSSIFGGILIGLCIGFIDNLLLFFGIQTFEEKFKNIIRGWGINDEKNLVTGIAGLGNTFSNSFKIFIGTYSHKILTDLFGIYSFPLWTHFLGILIGSILGILIPLMM